jgi:hypothetical protein
LLPHLPHEVLQQKWDLNTRMMPSWLKRVEREHPDNWSFQPGPARLPMSTPIQNNRHLSGSMSLTPGAPGLNANLNMHMNQLTANANANSIPPFGMPAPALKTESKDVGSQGPVAMTIDSGSGSQHPHPHHSQQAPLPMTPNLHMNNLSAPSLNLQQAQQTMSVQQYQQMQQNNINPNAMQFPQTPASSLNSSHLGLTVQLTPYASPPGSNLVPQSPSLRSGQSTPGRARRPPPPSANVRGMFRTHIGRGGRILVEKRPHKGSIKQEQKTSTFGSPMQFGGPSPDNAPVKMETGR